MRGLSIRRLDNYYRIGTARKSVDIDATPAVVDYSAEVAHRAVPIR